MLDAQWLGAEVLAWYAQRLAHCRTQNWGPDWQAVSDYLQK